MTSRNRSWVGAVLISAVLISTVADSQGIARDLPGEQTHQSETPRTQTSQTPVPQRGATAPSHLFPSLFFSEQPAGLWLAATGVA